MSTLARCRWRSRCKKKTLEPASQHRADSLVVELKRNAIVLAEEICKLAWHRQTRAKTPLVHELHPRGLLDISKVSYERRLVRGFNFDRAYLGDSRSLRDDAVLHPYFCANRNLLS